MNDELVARACNELLVFDDFRCTIIHLMFPIKIKIKIILLLIRRGVIVIVLPLSQNNLKLKFKKKRKISSITQTLSCDFGQSIDHEFQ